jgi:hypothetical protein
MQQTQLFIYINNSLRFYFLVKIRVLQGWTMTGGPPGEWGPAARGREWLPSGARNVNLNKFEWIQIQLKLIQTSFDPNIILPSSFFEIKYIFEGFEERNHFVHRNFFRFDVDFEWKFREASRFEIQ